MPHRSWEAQGSVSEGLRNIAWGLERRNDQPSFPPPIRIFSEIMRIWKKPLKRGGDLVGIVAPDTVYEVEDVVRLLERKEAGDPIT